MQIQGSLIRATFVVVLSLTSVTAVAAISQSERGALIALYNATGGPNWTNHSNWLGAPGTECTWAGVNCDGNQTTVLGLALSQNNLSGSIPPQIQQLANLSKLDFYFNNLSGPIPSELYALTSLHLLFLDGNRLTGTISPEIGRIKNLMGFGIAGNPIGGTLPNELLSLSGMQYFYVGSCEAGDPMLTTSLNSLLKSYPNLLEFEVDCSNVGGGSIPTSIAQHPGLNFLSLIGDGLNGSIPPEIGQLRNLRNLDLGGNQLTGPIPSSLWQLTALKRLSLTDNRLSGTLSGQVGNLKSLLIALFSLNDFSGSIPVELGDLTSLRKLTLSYNELTGSLPDLGKLTSLQILTARQNHLTGAFPAWVPGLNQLQGLALGGNQFEGPIPAALGNMNALNTLSIEANRFTGPLPSTLVNLTNLSDGASDFRYNLNFTGDPTLAALMAKKQAGGYDPFATQTLPPTNVAVTGTTQSSATLTWTPIAYTGDQGGYEILASTSPSGPFKTVLTTSSKVVLSATVTGLDPATNYFFMIRTVTSAHTYPSLFGLIDTQQNALTSDPSAQTSATTQGAAPRPAEVVVTSLPAALTQEAGASGATTTYALKNVGEVATMVTLTRTADFFTQSPTSFSLQPGATQAITITAAAKASGAYTGASIPSGTGVPANLAVPVKLLVAAPPAGTAIAQPEQNRIDIPAASGTSSTGTASFTNTGTDTLTGIFTSDAPWLIPPTDVITIAPGQKITITFQIDDSKRPDVVGSLSASLSLVYFAGGSATTSRMEILASGSRTVTTPVTVISTRPPQTSNTTIPALAAGEVALFLPGVGHVTGTVGVFLTDVTLANVAGAGTLTGVMLIFSSPAASTAQVSSFDQLAAGQPLALADLTKTVFNSEGQLGTLQVRAGDIGKVSASAVVLNSSNPKGTFGSSVPSFRSDRSVGAGQQMFITGIRQRAGTHTNMYLQETGGGSVQVTTEFFDANGNSLGTRSDALDRFGFRAAGPVFPPGTVSAVMTNASGATGQFMAYATPVDEGSGDSWAITDWSRQGGYASNESMLVTNVGALHGALGTYFRSDIAIFSTSTVASAANVRYYPRGGDPIDRQITLDSHHSFISDDVVTSLFGLVTDSSGYMVFTPTAGSFSVQSRTYTTPAGKTATLGTAAPTFALSQSLRSGQVRRIAGLEDASLNTIGAARPATFRTNFGLVETAGETATVRVTVSFSAAAGAKTTSQVTASKEYTLAPHQFLPVGGLTRDVVGGERETLFGDLHNVEVDFQLVSDTGAVTVYTTSIDNGTGDQIMRVE